MASALGKGAVPLEGAYTGAKHGIVGFTQTLQMGVHGSGIRVCLVLPGSMAMPLAAIHSRSKTGRARKALPPVFHLKRISRTLVRCAEHPRAVIKPDLQSKLAIPLGQLAPSVVKRVLVRYGERLQLTDEPEPSIGHGNVDTPMAEGTEVLGRWPPTGEKLARWVKVHRGGSGGGAWLWALLYAAGHSMVSNRTKLGGGR